MRNCSICDKKHYAKNFCEAHYKKHREILNLGNKKCSQKDCESLHYGWNLCRKHYKAEYKRRQRDKLHHTTEYKLEKNLRNKHDTALKKAASKSHPVKNLGCSISELKLFLESKFYDNPITGEQMNWKNRGNGPGKWCVHYIIPFSAINIASEEEQLMVCHYTNLRPLWHEDYSVKSAK